jgi:dTMP kinase
LLAAGSFQVQQQAELIRPTEMASINDLATAASALVTPAAAPHPPLPDSAAQAGGGGHEPAVARGALVVLEGLDRSGKTTQVKLLEQRFVELGRKVKVMRFPGMYLQHGSGGNEGWGGWGRLWNNGTKVKLTDGVWAKDRTTPIGQMIDSYLKSQVDMDDHVIHLLFSANRWEAAYGLTPFLAPPP